MIYRKISLYYIVIVMKPKTRTCVIGVVYANWCPHCKTLVGHDDESYKKSDWFIIKNTLAAADDGIEYIVDKTESEEKDKMAGLKKHHIVANGFPTIYKYYPGENPNGLEYFNGPRNIGSIKRWARSHVKGFKFSGGGGRLKSKRRIRRVNKTRRMTTGRGRMTRRL